MGEWTREKKRAAVYALVGIYLLYLAVQLFQGRLDDGGDVQWILIIFMVLFAGVGVGLTVFSVWRIWKGDMEDADGGPEDRKNKEEDV